MDAHAAQIVLQRNFGVQTGHAPLLPGQDIDTLIKTADTRMFDAKRARKGGGA